MPPSTIQRHQKIITIIGVFLLALFVLVYLVPYGGRSYLQLRGDLKKVRAEIKQLKAQNQELTDEIANLKNDPSYVEQIARQKLGMLKKNELVFEVPEKDKKGKKDKE